MYTFGHGNSIETIAGSGVGGGSDECIVYWIQPHPPNVGNGFTIGHDIHLESPPTTTTWATFIRFGDSCLRNDFRYRHSSELTMTL